MNDANEKLEIRSNRQRHARTQYAHDLGTWLALLLMAVPAFAQTEPGPENGGLQLRLVVLPHSQAGKEGYDVRVDLINATKKDVTLRAGWPYERDQGDVKDDIEASLSIETHPAIAPWVGQILMPHRTLPQPEYVRSMAVKYWLLAGTQWDAA